MSMRHIRRDLSTAAWWRHCLPWVQRGRADWCGRYLIIHAPVNLSMATGHGTSGLEWFRWMEEA